ncbi:MAG: NUDIX hydrolase [Candidatus Omnitrophota bacterium]
MITYKYCPICGIELKKIFLDGRDRLACPACNWINYLNPVPVVSCLVTNRAGGLLLIKRAIDPCKGHWALPGGFLELGETVEEGGMRELKEETGLDGTPGRLVGVYIQDSHLYGSVLGIGIEYFIQNENPIPGDDAEDVNFFPRNTLPQIPFSSQRTLTQKFFST